MSCTNCKIIILQTSSPYWRKGPDGKRTLCNACGLRWSRYQKKSKTALNYVPARIRKTKSSPDRKPKIKQLEKKQLLEKNIPVFPTSDEDIDLIIRRIKCKKSHQPLIESIKTNRNKETEVVTERNCRETLLDRYNAMHKT